MGSVRNKWKEGHSKLRLGMRWLAASFEGTVSAELSQQKARRRKRIAHYFYNVVFAVVLAFLLVDPGPQVAPVPNLKEGQVVEQDFVAPISADIEPSELKKNRREDLARKVAPIFDYDDAALESWLKKWQSAFRKIRQENFASPKAKKTAPTIESLQQQILEITGQGLSNEDLLFLQQHHFGPDIEGQFTKVGEYLLGRLISPVDLFPSHYSTGIIVRQVNQELTETLIYDLSRIWSLEQAREFLLHVPDLMKAPKNSTMHKIVGMLSRIAVPNLRQNIPLTEKRINNILGQSKPSLQTVHKGDLILKRGERVSDRQAETLRGLSELTAPVKRLQKFLLTTLILLVFFAVIFRMELTRKGFWYLSLKDALFFMAVALLSIMVAKYALPYLRIFFTPFSLRFGVEYLLPVAAGGIIIHLMMGKETAFTFTILTSIASGQLLDHNYLFSLWVLTVSASAIQSIKACKQRTDLYRCGVWSGTIGGLLVLAFALTHFLGFQHVEWMDVIVSAVFAFLSGIFSAILAGSMIPILESVLGYTTSLKLLELSNFNHPLLHNLMMKAPGTYHHSVIVGSLAEIAADRVKANALLARVAAYYHDIGKMTKPLYFIENQSPNNNPHDHLQPSMSAKILFSHVKNGARLAREYNLGSKITSVIEQHHGTTLVSYFFNKAKKAERPELDHVNEAEFHYPGPKPQSREAAIVMLADACEAATRSISEPTPAKIQTMVHSIINRRFLEDQFSECDLTFSDLRVIEDSFTRTLVSLYHHRIEYPGQKKSLAKIPSHPTPVAHIKKIGA